MKRNNHRRSSGPVACVYEVLESRQLMSAGGVPAGKVGGDLLADYATCSAGRGATTVAIDATASAGRAGRLLAELTAAGMTGGAEFDGIVSGYLPTASVDRLTTMPGLRFVRSDEQGVSAAPLSQDASVALGADDTRAVFGTTGAGVKVGVISNSFNATGGYAADQTAGLLPAVTVVADDLTKGNSDEGRAMCEVVHDVAPGAQLYFAASGAGQANMAQSILALEKAGCRVIVDDVLYYNEPFFEDGLIARAVDTVQAEGVTYFSSAGNYADNSYQGAWHAGTGIKVSSTALAGVAQNVATSGAASYAIPVTLPQGSAATFVLQWDANYASLNPATGGSKSQMDLYLVDSTGTKVVASGTTGTVGKDPIQDLYFTNTSATSDTFQLVTTLASGPAPTTVKVVLNGHAGDDASAVAIDKYNSGGSLDPHAAAAGSIPVAAVEYDTTQNYTGSSIIPTTEPFSSQGSDELLFDDTGNRLAKPTSKGIQITSVDGVDVDAHNAAEFQAQFFGTSCAAPNAAAVAALMLSSFPKATPAQILSAMQTTAQSLSPYSTAAQAGPGLLQAYEATLSLSSRFPAPAATGTVGGVVLRNDDLGEVGDYPDGGPIAGVTVELDAVNTAGQLVRVASVTTGSGGTFSFRNLKPGLYLAQEVQTGQFSPDYPVSGAYQLDLAAGQSATGLVFGDYLYQF